MESVLDLFYKYKFWLLGLVIALIIVFLMVSNKKDTNQNSTEYSLDLFGQTEMKINVGDNYIEPGYSAFYGKINVANEVIISGKPDTTKSGIYKIIYKIGDKIVIRTVIVEEIIKDDKPVDSSKIDFSLIGDEEITLNLNDEYHELGFKAMVDKIDLKEYVKIENNLDTSIAGAYYIVYKLSYRDQNLELKRKINILKENKEPLEISVTYDKSYQKEVILNVSVSGFNYKGIRLPNGVFDYKNSISYKVSKNGTYNFLIYDKDDKSISKSVTITNIDNIVDDASCTVNVGIKNSSIQINANDKLSGIKYYNYDGVNYYQNTINVNFKLKSANIIVYDNAKNSKRINCNINVVEKVYGFILIGDSRFVMMEKYLGSNKRPNDTFVAKVSMGFKWLNSTAIGKVNDILKKNPNRRYYILSNLGVNDYSSQSKNNDSYGSKLSSLANSTWKDHIVIYSSVNPYASVNDKHNKGITSFNEKQKAALNNVYYCDIYNGLGVANFKSSTSDKLHYNKATSLKIYDYIINNCSF